MDTEVIGMQPWQVFTAMFVVFWATSAYFDHFLMTGVFCIAFGVLGEISTKFMYGEKISMNLEKQKEELKSLLELVEKEELTDVEEEHTAELQNIEEHESQSEWVLKETIKADTEEFIEDEEDVPPPLPAKDYYAEMNDIIEVEKCSISGIVNSSNNVEEVFTYKDEQLTESNQNITTEVIEQINIIDTSMNNETYNNLDTYTNNCESLETLISSSHTTGHVIPYIEANIENTEINGEELEVEPSKPSEHSAPTPSTHLPCHSFNQNLQLPTEDVEIVEIQQDTYENKINIEGVEEIKIKLSETCLPEEAEQVDVSNDANKMVTLAESAVNNVRSEECDHFYWNMKSEEKLEVDDPNKNVDQDMTEEVINQSKVENENTICEEVLNKETEMCNTVSEAVTDISGNPEIDIDLTDPAVEAAATKIQSAFKGFKTRKNKANKK